jgi:hypothetical protein
MVGRVKARRSPLEAWSWVTQGGRTRWDSAAARPGLAGWRGPCVSEGRERRRRGWKARIKEENIFCGIRQRRMRAKRADEGNDGLWKRWAGAVKLSHWAGPQEGIQRKKYIFEFQRLLKFWQDFENFYNEI